ncbi:MAG: MarR family transcriptional regulator [Coriobacteriales bacterium]|jgi:DNA-binding MarR family transcriptional regulator|nr:MarR family transcriptional regulator [Coriobacteriales bacterium]
MDIANGMGTTKTQAKKQTKAEARAMRDRKYIFGGVLLLANKLQTWGDGMLGGLTLKQWFVLTMLRFMPIDEPTIQQVADYNGTSRQNTRKILDRLARDGYVRLKPSPTDKRATIVCLAAKTRTYLQKNADKGEEIMYGLFDGISSAELAGAATTISKMLKVLDVDPPALEGSDSDAQR